MTTQRDRPGDDSGAAAVSEGTTTSASLDDSAGVPAQLVVKADRALRAALREGLTGPDVAQLLDWVAQHRVQQRQRRARERVAGVLAEIQHAEGVAR